MLQEFEVDLKQEIPFLPSENLKLRIDYITNLLEKDEVELKDLDKAIGKVKLNFSFKKMLQQQARDKIDKLNRFEEKK